MTLKSILILVALLNVATFANSQDRYSYKIPDETDDGWKTGRLLDSGFDSLKINALFNQLISEDHKLHSILMVRNSKLLLEEYFGGYKTDRVHDLRSVTKSIIAILMGIAIDKGFITSIDDPVSNYLKFPEDSKEVDARKQLITLRHLLTMSSGLDCDDWNKKSKGQEDKVYKKKDWIDYTLKLPVINQPGEVSTYCTMGVTLAAKAIENSTNMSLDVFASQYLFGPLGILTAHWGHTTTGRDIITAGKRLYMFPRDMAKIGQLLLNDGRWNGKEIVSPLWVSELKTNQTKLAGMEYGYLWWNIPLKHKNQLLNSITATGNGGQYIIAVEEFDLVVVFTGGAYNSQQDKLPFAIMNNVIIPSIVEGLPGK